MNWDKFALHFLRGVVKTGCLRVTLADGSVHVIGTGTPAIALRLTDDRVLRRFLFNPELAMGEAYADGRLIIEDDDLRGFLDFSIQNRVVGGGGSTIRAMVRLHRWFDRALHWNSAAAARRNVAHHYDLSDELYDLFLDKTRQYTCAYYRTPDATLDQAQADKIAHLAAKLLIRPGMRVLDIGCGFGALAIALARDHGAHVVGVTLSDVQLAQARANAEAAGVADRVTFRMQDYRAVNEPFDRIVSVGMMEHVGLRHMPTYFRAIQRNLAPDGVALVHYIGRPTPPEAISPWFRKYIFPGAYCPTLSEVTPVIERSGLMIADIEVWRGHYERTLRHWLARFEANADRAAALYDQRFVRMWRFYLTAAELSFVTNRQVIHQVQLTKGQGVVPMTRDYLYPASNVTAISAREPAPQRRSVQSRSGRGGA